MRQMRMGLTAPFSAVKVKTLAINAHVFFGGGRPRALLSDLGGMLFLASTPSTTWNVSASGTRALGPMRQAVVSFPSTTSPSAAFPPWQTPSPPKVHLGHCTLVSAVHCFHTASILFGWHWLPTAQCPPLRCPTTPSRRRAASPTAAICVMADTLSLSSHPPCRLAQSSAPIALHLAPLWAGPVDVMSGLMSGHGLRPQT
mmetsp:Transcript_64109/g.105845  ORF Transcript_64109/g.105845 Transcript_64109/m.105845 type:complete len:200 (+) Transcript_64109:4493-5092(+)